jgi:hypothetical protein
MIADIEASKKYTWVLTGNGAPDMRLRKNRETVIKMASDLERLLKTEKRKQNFAVPDDGVVPTCTICMEEMDGRVSMKCGHEMCCDCFAQHARVNNTCPFCRDEFSKKVEVREKIPVESIESIVNQLYDPQFTSTPADYFHRAAQVIRSGNINESSVYLEYLIKANSNIAGRHIARWYDAE